MSAEPTCGYDGCNEPATQRVNTILGAEHLCRKHAWLAAEVDAEWDRAEAEYLEQP